MNLEKLFKLMLENPDNISITYSNINGEEKLVVNGETLSEEKKFDDSVIKQRVDIFKKNIDILDSCTLTDACDKIADEIICLKELDEMLNQEHYTEEEANELDSILNQICNVIKDTISDKINTLNELKDRF